ncbi:forkhead box protein P1 isoform X1 [Hippoglossus stenolepis]|uniref:forkhead box protein P1 isoform X1 n=1 Tax=Hippoglossus stenolepis TaxID=195615 RepID=UPI00159C8769|nr:forkhead box protein P1 isoform X1 [Hippoglossus stenolepis]XP_035015233.1 forkhead box protein P1 isoform X1 [Hippoglossus stenolepis]
MSSESVRCEQFKAQPPAPPQNMDMVSPCASEHQCSVEGKWQRQQRPSVLRQVFQTPSRQKNENNATFSICEEEVDGWCFPQSPSPPRASFLRQSHHKIPLTTDGPTQSSIEARIHDGISEGASALFVSGLCRWPGCEALSTDFPSFLKHLHSEHSHGDRSIAQCRVQEDIVQCMESQLILEKQKLFAMQLHLHLSELKHTGLRTDSEWPHSLPLFLPQPHVADGDRRGQQWCMKQLGELSQHGYRTTASASLLPDLVPSIEYYKYKNIRPPYTYAFLIRLSIVESPEKQLTLNEIYNWFTTMFFYFRHNTATWKNSPVVSRMLCVTTSAYTSVLYEWREERGLCGQSMKPSTREGGDRSITGTVRSSGSHPSPIIVQWTPEDQQMAVQCCWRNRCLQQCSHVHFYFVLFSNYLLNIAMLFVT